MAAAPVRPWGSHCMLWAVQDGLTVRMAVELVMQWGVVVHLPADVQALSLVTESPLDPAAGP